MPNISFQAPTDYSAEQEQIARQRQYADLLRQQSADPLQVQNTGMFHAAPSGIQGMAKALQAWGGVYGQQQADEKQKALSTKYQTDLADVLQRSNTAMNGSPAYTKPEATTAPDGLPMTLPSESVAGVKANPQMAAQILMQHPATQAMGMQEYSLNAANQRRAQMLAQIMKGDGGTSAAPGGAPGAAPGGAFAGMPPQIVALMTSGDPELVKVGTSMLEASKGIAQRPGAPVVNPFTGAVIAQPTPNVPPGMQLNVGPGGPVASPVPGYAGAKEGINSIPDPGASPIKVPLSGGQEAQLSQPEFLQYQKTGQLPARYGQNAPPSAPPQGGAMPNAALPSNAQGALTAIPANEVNQARAAGIRVNNGALGTPGLTQSQGDVINQARQQAGGKALDEQFAKDYASFVQGGASDAAKQIAQLGDVVTALKDPNNGLTGPIRGRLPDVVRSVTNPQAVAMRARVEEVVQRSLRTILGAQFTEKEGERLISRAYDPSMPQTENAVRVGRLFTQLQQAFAQKQDAAKYYEQNGTLEGWRGKIPSIADFDGTPGASGSWNEERRTAPRTSSKRVVVDF